MLSVRILLEETQQSFSPEGAQEGFVNSPGAGAGKSFRPGGRCALRSLVSGVEFRELKTPSLLRYFLQRHEQRALPPPVGCFRQQKIGGALSNFFSPAIVILLRKQF
jgi:hypothetical protein